VNGKNFFILININCEQKTVGNVRWFDWHICLYEFNPSIGGDQSVGPNYLIPLKRILNLWLKIKKNL